MPQSAVRSYFKEQSSARWELHIPEDAVARESHRWPIGFVTTEFVRGRSASPPNNCLLLFSLPIVLFLPLLLAII